MTNFNIGDRVRTLKATTAHIPAGATGTVDVIDAGSIWPVGVQFDAPQSGTQHEVYNPAELELLDPPTTAATLRSRADELTAKAEANREELRGLQERVNDLDREAWSLNGLAAQYRAVADDLEAQK